MGLKPPDWCAVPLHWSLHRRQHEMGERKFWASMVEEHPDFLLNLLTEYARMRYALWVIDNESKIKKD